MNKIITLSIIIFCANNLFSQNLTYTVNDSLEFVDENNNPIKLALCGGLHSPQFSACDLNGDGIKDLFVYDRLDGNVLTFINKGTPGQVDYYLDNRFAQYFPKFRPNTWVLMRDFNNDGYDDIFCNENGMAVYKNISYTVGGRPAFEKMQMITFRNRMPVGSPILFNILTIPNIHLPGIYDLDGDGDLDIASFSTLGGAITYYKNFQVELGLPADSFMFKMVTLNWGNFEDYDCNTYILNRPDIAHDIRKYNEYMRHTLGSSITFFDANNDGDIDMLLGNEGCDHMTMLYNGKNDHSRPTDTIIAYDTSFVSMANRMAVKVFPAAYFIDVNNDGKRDMIISPNSTAYDITEVHQVYWFENVGTDLAPIFGTKREFLTDQMLDVGRAHSLAAFDWDKDGDFDLMIVSNGNKFITQNKADRIYLYENIGNKTKAKFKLKDTDFGGFISRNIEDMKITLADMNGDGKTDIICGNKQGEILYYKNTSTSNSLSQTFTPANSEFSGFNINAGFYSAPCAIDFDKDGNIDLAVGHRDTFIQYYRNIGTKTEPDFILNTRFLGRMHVIDSISKQYIYDYDQDDNLIIVDSFIVYERNCYSTISASDVDNNKKTDFVIGNALGNLRLYSQEGSQASSVFSRTKPFNYLNALGGFRSSDIDFGGFISPYFVDFDGDTAQEILVALNRGGLLYLKPNFKAEKDVSVNTVLSKHKLIGLYPNPSNYQIEVSMPISDVNQIKIFGIDGKEIENFELGSNGTNLTINISQLTSGKYYLVILDQNNQTYSNSFVKF